MQRRRSGRHGAGACSVIIQEAPAPQQGAIAPWLICVTVCVATAPSLGAVHASRVPGFARKRAWSYTPYSKTATRSRALWSQRLLRSPSGRASGNKALHTPTQRRGGVLAEGGRAQAPRQRIGATLGIKLIPRWWAFGPLRSPLLAVAVAASRLRPPLVHTCVRLAAALSVGPARRLAVPPPRRRRQPALVG